MPLKNFWMAYLCIAIGINDVIGDHKRQTRYCCLLFFIGIVALIQAHPELHVAFSPAADFGFANAKDGVVVGFLFQYLFKFGEHFWNNFDFQHGHS